MTRKFMVFLARARDIYITLPLYRGNIYIYYNIACARKKGLAFFHVFRKKKLEETRRMIIFASSQRQDYCFRTAVMVGYLNRY